MKSIFSAAQALIQGAKICLSDSLCRKYALLPMLCATLGYLIFLPIAFTFQRDLISSLTGFVPDFLQSVAFYLLWIATALALFGVVFLLVTILTAILSGYFQVLLAGRVLQLHGYQLPAEDNSALGIASEMSRSIGVELKKLLWIVPLSSIAFLLSVIPVLAPISFPLGAWLVSYQYFDYPLEAMKLPSGVRRKLFFSRAFPLMVFGVTLVLLTAVPFVLIILPPLAAAGVSWLSGTESWIQRDADEQG